MRQNVPESERIEAAKEHTTIHRRFGSNLNNAKHMLHRKTRKALLNCAIAIIVVAPIGLSGCATVTRGTKDTLVVESTPSGASVRLTNGMSGRTPTSFMLPRKHAVVVTIEKEGYETATVNVTPQISGAGAAGMAGNVLVGGLVGAVVDPLSGAMKDLRPNPIKVTLTPLAVPKRTESSEIATPRSMQDRLAEMEQLLKAGLISEDEYKKQRSSMIQSL